MKFYVGVDGGGSRTRVVVADARGEVRGWGETGLANLHHASETEVRENLARALNWALSDAGGTSAEVVSVFFGMAGVTCEATASKFRRLAAEIGLGGARLGIDHDIRIALAGGLGGKPGIALIVGTGSSCYGRDAEGRTWQTGGWGYLVADEGSGYDVGRQAMVAAVRMSDGRMAGSGLAEHVFRWLGVGGVSEILARLYEKGIERSEIAALAPGVVRLAEAGDGAARLILERGARELAGMVEANHGRLPTGSPPRVTIAGGLGTAPTLYRELIRKAIADRVEGVVLPEAEMEPVLGACLLALEQVGEGSVETWVPRLRASAAGCVRRTASPGGAG